MIVRPRCALCSRPIGWHDEFDQVLCCQNRRCILGWYTFRPLVYRNFIIAAHSDPEADVQSCPQCLDPKWGRFVTAGVMSCTCGRVRYVIDEKSFRQSGRRSFTFEVTKYLTVGDSWGIVDVIPDETWSDLCRVFRRSDATAVIDPLVLADWADDHDHGLAAGLLRSLLWRSSPAPRGG